MARKTSKLPFPLQDRDSVKTLRHLRFMTALFEIDDPEVEEALAVILERLAAAARAPGKTAPPSLSPGPRGRRKAPH
jgi:hypothetical protein